MAENKKSFVLYTDYIEVFEQLTDVEAGELIKHLFRYVNDKDPVTDNRLLKILFEPIKQQLKRDLRKWEGKREKLSEAGKASAEKRRLSQQMSTNVEQPQPTPTVNVTDTVTVNVTANVIDNVIDNVIPITENSGRYWFLKFYHGSYENYKNVFNGQSTTDEYFAQWKKFIDFIYEKKYETLFDAKFINPHSFEILVKKEKFTEDKWDETIKKILATGIKPEHDLFFRIPEFMKYLKDKNGKSTTTTVGKEIKFDKP